MVLIQAESARFFKFLGHTYEQEDIMTLDTKHLSIFFLQNQCMTTEWNNQEKNLKFDTHLTKKEGTLILEDRHPMIM